MANLIITGPTAVFSEGFMTSLYLNEKFCLLFEKMELKYFS